MSSNDIKRILFQKDINYKEEKKHNSRGKDETEIEYQMK